jgi:hypothetical protein
MNMEYDFNNPWGLDKAECEWLTGFCRQHKVAEAIEFGPGNSSLAILDGGAALIESFEQDEKRTAELCLVVPARISLHHYRGNAFPITSSIPHDYDFAFIDGPTGDSIVPARINAALFCFRRARLIAFHDAKRDEQTIRIMLELGMREMTRFDSGRGIVVLEHTGRGV